MKSIIAAALALVLTSLPAFADGYEPAGKGFAAPAISWTGFYLGGFAGAGWAKDDHADVDGKSGNDPGTVLPSRSSGFIGGAMLGYMKQFDTLVLGIEADAIFGDLHSRGLVDVNSDLGNDGSKDHDEFGEADYNFIVTLRGRVGLALNGFHIYGTGGLAIADIENEYIDFDGQCFCELDEATSFKHKKTRLGYAVGGGVEWMFSESWIARAEGLFMDFGNTGPKQSGKPGADDFRISWDDEVVVARVAFSRWFP